jgi:peptide deformylase
MWNALERANGIGLAANQIGFFNRMFVMKGSDGKRYEIMLVKGKAPKVSPASERPEGSGRMV